MRPLLKWPGGKRRQVDVILELLEPSITDGFTYVEPFLGGGAVFCHLHNSGAAYLAETVVLADFEPRLIGFYRNVRDQPSELYEVAKGFFSDLSLEDYNDVRDAFNDSPPESLDSAAMMLWLNKSCFNGLWRTNKSGNMNTPVGDKVGNLPEFSEFEDWSSALQDVALLCCDFEETIAAADLTYKSVGTIAIYADPPYMAAEGVKSSFTSYTRGGFGHGDQTRLRDLLVSTLTASPQGGTALISNHNTEDSRRFYGGWSLTFLNASRGIGARTGKTNAKELIAKCYVD